MKIIPRQILWIFAIALAIVLIAGKCEAQTEGFKLQESAVSGWNMTFTLVQSNYTGIEIPAEVDTFAEGDTLAFRWIQPMWRGPIESTSLPGLPVTKSQWVPARPESWLDNTVPDTTVIGTPSLPVTVLLEPGLYAVQVRTKLHPVVINGEPQPALESGRAEPYWMFIRNEADSMPPMRPVGVTVIIQR